MEATSVLIWFSQKALQAQQHALDIVNRAPLILEDIQTDPSGEIDVGVIDGGLEEHRRRRVWVVRGEFKRELEGQFGVGGVVWATDGGSPE